MTTQETSQDRFKSAQSIFANHAVGTSPTKAGAKKFKYEVKSPGVIHTTARKNNVGAGLNELNAKKKTHSAVSKPQKPHVNVMQEANELNPFRKLRERSGSISSSSSTSSIDFEDLASSAQADIDRMMMENINAFEQNPNVQSKSNPATIDDMLFGGINDPTPCLEPQRSEAPKVKKQVRFQLPEEAEKSSTNAKIYNPMDDDPVYKNKKRVSPDRFKPKHQSQKIEQPDFTKPVGGYSNLVRCANTYSGKTFEPKMERKSDNNVSPRKKAAESPMHFPTRGNGKKGVIQPNASYNQELQSKVSGVNVSEIVNIFNGKNR
ncbi:hypothetical protein [Wolbachia endosymbiont of Folsomia candida]|uniref:hypothetical protein n=1 Tax=Wolbachia endosymbiont of Folsomia candida TaxID=169402 RepID=UPI000B314FFB|nr:hypothetical protein [Wolbachia endosymbiont of Folsomia candida]APR98396.1 hypothetical protein ASM33_03855 [Wolbachia endosymbiont of Folsomia candida]